MVSRVRPTPTRFPNNILHARWTTHLWILYQVCGACGAPLLRTELNVEASTQEKNALLNFALDIICPSIGCNHNGVAQAR